MVAIDPGVVNPGKVWVAHDVQHDVYYLYRAEKGLTKLEGSQDGARLTSKEHGKHDVGRAAQLGERVIWWAVGAKSEGYWREDYRAAGAKAVLEPDAAAVEEGINRGTLLIKEHRFIVFDDLYEFIDEMLRYSREIKDGEVTKNIKDKATFHLMDAFRYFAMQVVNPSPVMQTKVGVKRYAQFNR
jgi:hypothetical protein